MGASLRKGMVNKNPPPPKKKKIKKKDYGKRWDKLYKHCVNCNDIMVKEAQPDSICLKCKRVSNGKEKGFIK